LGVNVSRAWSRLSAESALDSKTHAFQATEGPDLKIALGSRVEVKWPDGLTTGHGPVLLPGTQIFGVSIEHHGAKAYVALVSPDLQVRIIPPGKPFMKGLGSKTKTRDW
jgi:hypothetical protein